MGFKGRAFLAQRRRRGRSNGGTMEVGVGNYSVYYARTCGEFGFAPLGRDSVTGDIPMESHVLKECWLGDSVLNPCEVFNTV